MNGETSELELRDYLGVLRRRLKIVVLTVVVVVGASLGVSFLQEPVYSASARLLMQTNQSESPFDPGSGAYIDPARSLDTNIEVLKSELVESEVRERIGAAPNISARPVGQTDVVLVTAESTDPERAAEVANTYAEAFRDVRREQAVEGLLTAGEEIQEKIGTLEQQIRSLDDQVTAAGPGQEAVRESTSDQRQALVQQQALFKSTLDKITVDANLASGGAQLVGRAVVPTTPVKPRPVRSAILAGVLGLLLGVGLAFLVEYLDDSIKSREDLERLSGMVPVIGVIPALSSWKERDEARLISISDPGSGSAEAYRTLRTAIQFVGLDRVMGVVQVTSSSASEGKTTTLANLGVALAKAGERVILVCCDLRRPRLHEFFGLSNEVGFTSLLLGNVPITRALQAVPDVPRLRVLASGPLPPNPSELLSTRRVKDVFAALKAECDIVLIDSPPVLPVTDALVLFRQVDATLMVFAVGSTTQKQASTALAMAQQMEAPLIGTVLNGVPSQAGYAYGAYGVYGGSPGAKPKRNEAANRAATSRNRPPGRVLKPGGGQVTNGDSSAGAAPNGRVADGQGGNGATDGRPRAPKPADRKPGGSPTKAPGDR